MDRPDNLIISFGLKVDNSKDTLHEALGIGEERSHELCKLFSELVDSTDDKSTVLKTAWEDPSLTFEEKVFFTERCGHMWAMTHRCESCAYDKKRKK